MDEIIVIDDFIDLDYQETIKSILMGQEEHNDCVFPWYYIEDVTVAYDDDSKHRPGLSHQYVNLPKEWAEDNDEPLKPKPTLPKEEMKGELDLYNIHHWSAIQGMFIRNQQREQIEKNATPPSDAIDSALTDFYETHSI